MAVAGSTYRKIKPSATFQCRAKRLFALQAQLWNSWTSSSKVPSWEWI